jgi:hypothetical protein
MPGQMITSGLQVNAAVAGWEKDCLAAVEQAGLGAGQVRALTAAFSDLRAAFGGLSQAQAQISEVGAGRRPGTERFMRSEKLALARQIAQGAQAAAESALSALDGTRQDIAATLNRALAVKKPAGLDPVTLADKRHDLRELVKRKGGAKPESVLFALRDVLSAAMDAGDDVRTYILAVELDDFAESMGVSLASWADLKNQVIAKHKASDGTGVVAPGSQVWRCLVLGGEGTLSGALTYWQATLRTIVAQTDALIQQSGQYWQDGYGGTGGIAMRRG